MSLFEGLEDMDLSAPELSYDPGEADCDLRFVDALVQHYIEEKRDISYFDRAKNTLKLMPMLERGIKDDFHPNAFLDCLMTRLGQWWDEQDKIYRSILGPNLEIFLDMVIQGLYCKGYNDLVVTLSPLGDYFRDEMDIANLFIASEDRPLRLKCIGDVKDFGRYAKNCVLELDGDAWSAGKDARSSRFILHGNVEEIAEKSEHCRFDIEQPAKIGSGAKDTVIYARDGVSKGGLSSWGYVREETNTLYVTDSNGAWGRVGPDGEVVRE